MNQHWFKGCLLTLLAHPAITVCRSDEVARDQPHRAADVVVVVGAAGTPEYADQFDQWSQRWREAAELAEVDCQVIGPPGQESASDQSDRQRLLTVLEKVPRRNDVPLWLVLIGHGTYYQNVAKFNLVGRDITAKELSQAVNDLERPLVLINSASASGPFIDRLSGPQRIVVTATRSGLETNFAYFGDFFSSAIASSNADLDHDDQVSVLEAFVRASGDVQAFYDSASRLSTEHALLDDNGDGRGTPATLYQGLRPAGEAKDGAEIDGDLARRITLAPAADRLPLTGKEFQERQEIERAIESLRSERPSMAEDEYYERLERLLLRQAKLYERAEKRRRQDRSDS